MRIRIITSWGLALLALSAQVTHAQNLEDLVQRLVRQTDTLAQRSYDNFSSRRNPSRYDIEALYQSRSLNASAELFQRMVRDRRSDGELRDAFAVLQDLFRNSGRYGFDRRYWSDIQRTSEDLSRELNVHQRDPEAGRPPYDSDSAHFRTAALARKNRRRNPAFDTSFRCGIASHSGLPASATTFNFTSPLREELWMFGWRRSMAEEISKSSNSPRETTISRPWLRFGIRRADADDYEFELIW